jgi:hypothetical protein
MRDSDPRLPRCKRVDTITEPLAELELTATPSAACTSACTGEGDKANVGVLEATLMETPPQVADANRRNAAKGLGASPGTEDTLATLAAVLLTLSLADRERLAAMLAGR